MTEARNRKSPPADIPALEWIAAGIGLLLTLAILGVMAWQAIAGGTEPPPAVEVRIAQVVAVRSGYAVEIELSNHSPATAAGVEVQGDLLADGRVVESSRMTIDYVPGFSTRRAGLYFRADPRAHALDVRALGYSAP